MSSEDFLYPMVIDGGLSNELEDLGCNLNHFLWSARIIESDPESIIKVHYNYLNSGAKIISTTSYQASVKGFMKLGMSREKAIQLLKKSVELAEIAVENFLANNPGKKRPYIAASLGPHAAVLADGSEYKGRYTIQEKELFTFHKERIEILEESNSDIFALETIPNYMEAKVLSEILAKSQKESWVSFSCKDDKHINDGTPIRDCIKLFQNNPRVFALGVNCTSPKYISGLIKEIKPFVGNKRIIVYPNSGAYYDPDSKSWSGTSEPLTFKESALKWIEEGADIIGGCCRIGAGHIKKLSQAIQT